ncbi:hypothetical protein RP20_CCG019852 [Aedes albopictus]|nr:hypothetical protein RP20_CCG019852 [Aedes albopictus]
MDKMPPSSSKKPAFSMMSTNVRLCRAVGLWYDPTHWRFTWQTVFIISTQVLWFMLPTVAFMIRREKTFAVQLKPILEIVEIGVIVFRTSAHWNGRRLLTNCFDDLRKTFGRFSGSAHEDIRRTLRHLDQSADYLVKIYVFVVLFQALTYGPLTTFITIVRYLRKDESLVLASPVLEADYVFFDHLSTFSIWLPSSLISVTVQFMMVISTTASECLLWNLLHHTSSLFRIVRYELSRLDGFAEWEPFRNQFAAIANAHDVAFRCTQRLESVLSPVLAMLYCSCVFQTCYVVFVASVVEDPIVIASMIFILQYTTFLIFSFSMLGTELMEQV